MSEEQVSYFLKRTIKHREDANLIKDYIEKIKHDEEGNPYLGGDFEPVKFEELSNPAHKEDFKKQFTALGKAVVDLVYKILSDEDLI